MLFYIDEAHSLHKNIAEKVSSIVYTNEFILLQSELESLYKKMDFDRPKIQAFQDALYSFLAQGESLKPVKAF